MNYCPMCGQKVWLKSALEDRGGATISTYECGRHGEIEEKLFPNGSYTWSWGPREEEEGAEAEVSGGPAKAPVVSAR